MTLSIEKFLNEIISCANCVDQIKNWWEKVVSCALALKQHITNGGQDGE